jgi:hypothetical protein
MAQIFHPALNTVAKASILGFVAIIGALAWAGYAFQKSPYYTDQDVTVQQPIPFSHEHHVRGLGIDCRYCHTSVEDSSFAGIPPTETCMSCHSRLYTSADMLGPIRRSWETDRPLQDQFGQAGWTRVHVLPGFVYFDHSIHVNKGVGCSTCHGRVDLMPLMSQAATLQMEWCLDCHRDPVKNLRPRDKIYDMTWEPPANQLEIGKKLAEETYHVASSEHLTRCYVCHR